MQQKQFSPTKMQGKHFFLNFEANIRENHFKKGLFSARKHFFYRKKPKKI